ncbi:hypothetical protein MG293_001659 [Ovis ammon polii]|uniref:Uncharacterized protein n=1 Tax=Ovis ammon polii TaxID=230172 RepID=A0AAD4UQG1_OVIAM|nr:hypothetical protein MG293_001659 [Ovis ammon polii]
MFQMDSAGKCLRRVSASCDVFLDLWAPVWGSVQKNPCPLVLLAFKHSANPTDNRHNQRASSQLGSRARVRRDQRQMSAVDLYGAGRPRTVFQVSMQLTLGG